jgi:hypothetical protein
MGRGTTEAEQSKFLPALVNESKWAARELTMKRVAYLCWMAAIVSVFLVSFAAAQSDSLGDYARQVRKQKAEKRAASGKQFDDDTMPKIDSVSVVGKVRPQPSAEETEKAKKAEASDDSATNDAAKSDAKDQSKPDGAAKSDGQASSDDAAQREKANQDWQKRIAERKSQIDMLNRELDVMQREYKLRAAAMYADAGNRMRNSTQWDKEDADYKVKLAAKQKALDDAKQELEDIKEQARKAGVPASYRE